MPTSKWVGKGTTHPNASTNPFAPHPMLPTYIRAHPHTPMRLQTSWVCLRRGIDAELCVHTEHSPPRTHPAHPPPYGPPATHNRHASRAWCACRTSPCSKSCASRTGPSWQTSPSGCSPTTSAQTPLCTKKVGGYFKGIQMILLY